MGGGLVIGQRDADGPPSEVREEVLNPGQLSFGGGELRLKTMVGSCVAVTLWHPTLRVGGMCHYLVPSRERAHSGELDGRYANEALELLMRSVRRTGTPSEQWQVKVFGGGNMFPNLQGTAAGHVGDRNVEVARELLRHHGLRLLAEDVAGLVYRNVVFNVWSGEVWVRRQATSVPSHKRGGK
jgi:chemotaxis protein CheD